MTKAETIVQKMYDNDSFSKWLNINIVSVSPGKAILQMPITDLMLNGFDIAHGGISYSLADSALAFAANGYGKMAVSVETSISHTNRVLKDDVITATCTELNRTNKIAIYQVNITNQNNVTVALFKGTVYITDKNWETE